MWRNVWSMNQRVPDQEEDQRGPGEVVKKDCQAHKLNKEDAVDCSRWWKLIKDVWWTGWVWVGECFFWFWPTRVVPDKGPLNICVCVCVFQDSACIFACWLTVYRMKFSKKKINYFCPTLFPFRWYHQQTMKILVCWLHAWTAILSFSTVSIDCTDGNGFHSNLYVFHIY